MKLGVCSECGRAVSSLFCPYCQAPAVMTAIQAEAPPRVDAQPARAAVSDPRIDPKPLAANDRWASVLNPFMISVVVWLVYLFACMSPVVKQTPDGISRSGIAGTVYGYEALMLGWVTPSFLPWSANILLFVGWVCLLFRRYQAAFVSGIAAVLASSTVWVMPLKSIQCAPCAELLVGCFFWQSSFVLFAAGTFAICWLRRRQKEEQELS